MNLQSLLFALCSIVCGLGCMVASVHHSALIAQQCYIALALRINHIANYILTLFCSRIEANVKYYMDGEILFSTLLISSWKSSERCQTDSIYTRYKKHSCSIPVGITLPQHLCISDQLVISQLDLSDRWDLILIL